MFVSSLKGIFVKSKKQESGCSFWYCQICPCVKIRKQELLERCLQNESLRCKAKHVQYWRWLARPTNYAICGFATTLRRSVPIHTYNAIILKFHCNALLYVLKLIFMIAKVFWDIKMFLYLVRVSICWQKIMWLDIRAPSWKWQWSVDGLHWPIDGEGPGIYGECR